MGRYLTRLEALTHRTPHATAVLGENRVLSYRHLLERVDSAASWLSAHGVAAGSRVGLTIADEIENLVATLALLRAGAWQITLASHDSHEVHADLARQTDATHHVSEREGALLPGVQALSWPAQLPAAAFEWIGAEGGLFLRTSGTTGKSNLVPFTESDIAIQAERNPEYRTGRHLRLASIEHNNSKRHRLYCLYMGAVGVFRPPELFDVADFCLRHAVSCVDMSIMHAVDLAHRGRGNMQGIDIRVGGSSTPYTVRQQLEERVSRRLYVRYGSTETGTIALCGPGQHDTDEAVGAIVDGLEVEVVDDEARPLPTGSTGHIRIRGEGIAGSYWKGQEQSARRFRDGWFWPGDVGYLRADGHLVLKGRSDEMIVLNGVNIFPAELERVLEEYPGVRSAAVAALKSKVHGDIPVAAVELDGTRVVAQIELMRFARNKLALRAPRMIVFVDSLPRNSQGKIVRRDVASIVDDKRKSK